MFPRIIYIETTNLCNAKCIMCPHQKLNRTPAFMSDAIFEKTVSDIEDISLSGGQIFLHKEGEPLLDPKIMARLKYTTSRLGGKNEVGISTNGMLFTPDKADSFIETGANLIFFSVDGVEKDEYEQIRVNLKYEVVEKNIKYFLNRCKNENLKIRVVMQMLINSKDNHSNLFIEKWKNYPCEFYIKEMHSYLDGEKSIQTKKISTSQLNFCEDPFKLIVIYTNGSAGLCCWDYNNEYSIGNITNSSLLELFNSEKAELLRKAITSKQCKNIIPCNRCARIFGNDHITPY